MRYKILKEQYTNIEKQAQNMAKKGNREVCGFLVNNGYFIELCQTKNKVKRGGGFSFYVPEVRTLQNAVNYVGHEIIGTFHSHPKYIDEPSESDITNAPDNTLMFIFDVIGKKASLWQIKNLKKKKIRYQLI